MSDALIRSLPIWKGAVQIDPLEGGITNLNYRVTDGAEQYAVRAGTDDPRLGIDRRNEIECTRTAAAIGVAPALAHASPGIMVSAFVEATLLTPELAREPGRIPRVAAAIRQIHAAGPSVNGHLRYFSPFQVVRTYVALARDEGLALPADSVDSLLAEVRDLETRIEPFVPTFCHNDLMPGNLLDTGERVWIIDWEYAGIGHPLFDLAGLSSNCDFEPAQDQSLLEAYSGNSSDEVTRQFRAMRPMAALRESLWSVIKGSDSEIDFDYDGYRDENYSKYRAALAVI